MSHLLNTSSILSAFFIAFGVIAAPLDAEKQLRKISKSTQCQIVMTAPQKDDSVLRLETENVIAVWCTTSLQEANPLYDILISIKDSDHEWVDCPSLIPIAATHTPPFIDIKAAKINGKTQQLGNYNYLSRDKATAAGPESEIADGNGLFIGHWDAEQTLYCYNDKWLISEFH